MPVSGMPLARLHMSAIVVAVAPVIVVGSLAGCAQSDATALAAAKTVTVSVTPSPVARTLRPGDTAPIDLAGFCASEGMIETAQQTILAGAMSASRSTIEKTVRLMYLDLQAGQLQNPLAGYVTRILDTDPTSVNPDNTVVMATQQQIAERCLANKTPVSVAANGG